MSTNSQNPVFIVSTGRSGSKMLARTLALHPQLFSVHEPAPSLNAEAYVSWKGTHSDEKLSSKIKSKRGDMIEQVRNNGLTYIESSHYCSHLIPWLSGLFDGRFIFLHRDGRDFVRSGMEREWFPESIFHHPKVKNSFRELIKRKIRRTFILDIGYTWDDHKLEPPSSCTTRVEKISWLWNEVNGVILRSLSHLDRSRYMTVRLEDFGEDVLRDLAAFIGMDLSDTLLDEMVTLSRKRPNRTTSRSIVEFEEWTDAEKQQFWNQAKPMMEQLNYIKR